MSKNIKLKNLISEGTHFVNPKCPNCHHYNAMLKSYKKKSNKNGVSVLECRDCGFESEYSEKEMVDIKSPVSGNIIQTYKRLDGTDAELNEDGTNSFNYYTSEIKRFISQSDTSSPYKPQIKLHWGGDNGEANTKWLNVEWEVINQILKILEKNK